jgi:hypothetical protein
MLIQTVEQFLRRHAMSPSLFGRLAAQDPRLVTDLRAGRAPRSPLDQRLRGFLEGFELARTYAVEETPDEN